MKTVPINGACVRQIGTQVLDAIPKIQFASTEGKKLFVTGEGFVEGSVIEINDRAQKTKLVEPVLFPTLVAKKGGKKIDPGEMVMLTVLNPDGARSAPFKFTRPAE